MCQFVVLVLAVCASDFAVSAPVPITDARALVAKLGDPSERVRDEASAALKDRLDALPWLRRAARSKDKDTSARATALLKAAEAQRQRAVPAALDACLRDGAIDLFTEWHQYWRPQDPADLWAVGPKAAQPGLDLFAKTCPAAEWERFQERLGRLDDLKSHAYDGPWPGRFERVKAAWNIRTDRLPSSPQSVRFAAVGGPAMLEHPEGGGRFLSLGPVGASMFDTVFVACDGDVCNEFMHQGVRAARAVLVCRGNFTGWNLVGSSVVLADGDIDLTRVGDLKDCLIRASGDIRLPNVQPVNCTIESHAKNATAPYRFFELADVGLRAADDEEGLVVVAVARDTPFARAGLQKGDLIRKIDDADAGHSEQLRKALRRALVRQGDCLLTVARGNDTLDLPVFFPTPK
ncbi:MAG: PDZ domain-containing protein [Gemmataceae bacterium]|nr:PDZ domain-containing protein [Gemmataceae bacterium]